MFGNGAVGTPSIAFANSTTTGFYRISADTIGVATAGVLRATFASTGGVVIATPTSGTALTLPSAAATTSFAAANAFLGIGTAFVAAQSELFTTGTNPLGIGSTGAAALNLYTTSVNRLAISSAGNVVVNPPSSGIPLTVSQGTLGSTANPSILITASAANQASLSIAANAQVAGTGSFDLIQDGSNNAYVYNRANGPINFGTNNTTRAVISAAGQTTLFESLNAINALKNAATYETGSFTGTLTGCTTSPTTTCNWSRNGNSVTLEIGAVSAISNAVTCTITGLPAAIQPVRSQQIKVAAFTDNTTTVSDVNLSVTAGSNIITHWKGGSTGGFTAAGTKGYNSAGTTVTYNLT